MALEFDDFDWGGLAGKVLSGVVQAAPAVIAGTMQNRTLTRANNQAAQIAETSNAAALNEVRTARENAERTGAPGVAYMRNVVARDPSMLTPAQQISISDSQREFNRGPALKSYGGRAHARMFADVSNRMRAGAVQQNTQRQDAAATNLTGVATQGRDMTPAIAQIQARSGDPAANAINANASVTADTMGQIASVFANSVKDNDRERRYQDYRTSYQ